MTNIIFNEVTDKGIRYSLVDITGEGRAVWDSTADKVFVFKRNNKEIFLLCGNFRYCEFIRTDIEIIDDWFALDRCFKHINMRGQLEGAEGNATPFQIAMYYIFETKRENGEEASAQARARARARNSRHPLRNRFSGCEKHSFED